MPGPAGCLALHPPGVGATNKVTGFLKEQFTSADSYVVQFHAPIGGALGAMIISSTVAIDIAIKEGSSLRGDSYYRRYK